MARLIDANRLKALLMVDFMQLELFGKKYKVSDAMRTVDNTPTEDAVPVIRCKDCKWYAHCDDCYGDCMKEGAVDGFVYTNDYCSRAEPKETTEEVRKQLKDMEQRREMDRKK